MLERVRYIIVLWTFLINFLTRSALSCSYFAIPDGWKVFVSAILLLIPHILHFFVALHVWINWHFYGDQNILYYSLCSGHCQKLVQQHQSDAQVTLWLWNWRGPYNGQRSFPGGPHLRYSASWGHDVFTSEWGSLARVWQWKILLWQWKCKPSFIFTMSIRTQMYIKYMKHFRNKKLFVSFFPDFLVSFKLSSEIFHISVVVLINK